MEVIKFTLEGSFGFFKKPDVNSYIYFTYGNIHRVALLGIFGAILGYGGYNQMSFKKKYKKDFKDKIEDSGGEYPEFYERLKHLKVAITPKEASISKKVQVFNNSVGYASHEAGGNLIVKEQWLENPSWTVYVAVEDEEGQKLSRALLDGSFIYIPYLGKNDHFADIRGVEIIPSFEVNDSPINIDSLFVKKDFKIAYEDMLNPFREPEEDATPIFKYEEKLPVALEKDTNRYDFESLVYTNSKLINSGESPVYRVKDKNIVFV